MKRDTLIEKLKYELAEARETLRAIQSGEVDALVVNDENGERIFTLKNADQPYRIMVETMSEGAATLRKDGMIFYCNHRFAELLNRPLETLVGSSIYSHILDKELLAFKQLIESGSKSRGNKIFTLKTRAENKIVVQISISPTEVESDIGVCILATDLTERINAEEELRKSYDLLEARVKERTAELATAVKVRDDFLSIASHELKTPLTSLKLQTQIRKRRLSKNDLVSFEAKNIGQLFEDDERQVDRLIRLVDDMLDLSRLNSGKLSLEFQEFDMCEVVREVVRRVSPQTQESEITFKEKGVAVGKWDRYRMEQIITNLLTNAVKYGAKKPIDIKVESDNEKVKLAVKDQGIGIAKKDQERIFGQFERAISVNEVSGLGLGLYIVKQLVDAHRGRVWVESNIGRGSTFFIELPVNLT